MDTSNWKWYSIEELFHPQKCKCSNATELLTEGDEIAYVGAKKKENGVMGYVLREEKYVTKGNCIVFIGDGQGSVGYATYQPVDFIGSTTLLAGYNKSLNQYNAQFIVGIVDCERYRYSFGRKFNKRALERSKILLPAIDDKNPDWQYMEDFVKSTIIPNLPEKAKKVWSGTFEQSPIKDSPCLLDVDSWHWFRYDEIFNIKKGKRLTSADQFAGEIPYIGAIDSNNGVSTYIGNNEHIHSGNTITISYNGSIGQAYYQAKDFWATDDVNVLYPKFELNKYIALFLVTLIEKEKFRFCYGRKWKSDAMRESKIKLPVTANGTPDWQFMEDYIKSLPYSKSI